LSNDGGDIEKKGKGKYQQLAGEKQKTSEKTRISLPEIRNRRKDLGERVDSWFAPTL
jgi:hypothetical protein